MRRWITCPLMTPVRLGPLAWLALAATACASTGPSAPEEAAEVVIVLEVTGGIAAFDYGYTVHGPSLTLLGHRCRRGCDWQPGETLGPLAQDEVLELARLFVNRGFFDLERDYGVQCCDQFEYLLSYRDRDDQHSVHGSDGTLPATARELIAAVRALAERARQRGAPTRPDGSTHRARL